MATRTANVMARVEPDVKEQAEGILDQLGIPASCLLYTSPSPRDRQKSRMPSSA